MFNDIPFNPQGLSLYQITTKLLRNCFKILIKNRFVVTLFASRPKRSPEDDDALEERRIKENVSKLRLKIKTQILKTIKSVEDDIFKFNVHNVILSMSNLLGGNLGLKK